MLDPRHVHLLMPRTLNMTKRIKLAEKGSEIVNQVMWRSSWIMQVDPIQSHELFRTKEECRRVGQKCVRGTHPTISGFEDERRCH